MKIAIIASRTETLISVRRRLIQDMIQRGHQVMAYAPYVGSEILNQLTAFGIHFKSVPLARTSVNFVKDIYLIWVLWREFCQIRPDVVFSYTIKPVIYGTIAAWAARVKFIYSMITGLGAVYASDDLNQRALRLVVNCFYRISLKKNKKVFFQNPDDLNFFNEQNLLSCDQKTILVNGSGVDLIKFSQTIPPIKPIQFTLICRLIKTKGIREFTEAAKILIIKNKTIRFCLVGMKEKYHPDRIEDEVLDDWRQNGQMELLSWGLNVVDVLNRTSVYVLPSYREGIPNSVLEAMAVGRAIITTDVPGCRETVVDGINGFLVLSREVEGLVKAMERFIETPSLIEQMGQKSRRLVEERFDVRLVNRLILSEMKL